MKTTVILRIATRPLREQAGSTGSRRARRGGETHVARHAQVRARRRHEAAAGEQHVCGVGDGSSEDLVDVRTRDSKPRTAHHVWGDATVGSKREAHFAAEELYRAAAGGAAAAARVVPNVRGPVHSRAADQYRESGRWRESNGYGLKGSASLVGMRDHAARDWTHVK
jgi:hypothetical protein